VTASLTLFFVGDATKFAENYSLKSAGEHMFHGKSGKYLRF